MYLLLIIENYKNICKKLNIIIFNQILLMLETIRSVATFVPGKESASSTIFKLFDKRYYSVQLCVSTFADNQHYFFSSVAYFSQWHLIERLLP